MAENAAPAKQPSGAGELPEVDDPEATRVVLSIPADLVGHGRDRIDQPYYRTFLRRAHDTVAEGDEWNEFTDVGCCGSQQEVPFRVERVDGGSRIGPDTRIEYVERGPAGLACDWSYQNDEPTAESG